MIKSIMSKEEMLKKLREKMSERKGGHRDPDQFIPPKAKKDEKLEYFFRVLPPLQAGDTYKGGVCEKDQDIWFYENGNHWINNERLECPRMHDREECPICTIGFDLMRDNDDDAYKAGVRKKYMPRSGYAINIYFVNSDKNPENLRGRVMWMSVPKTVYDIMNECVENADPGTTEDPKPCGVFYHPTDGGYVFKLVAENQGQWNTYERSGFLVNSAGPLAKGTDGKPDIDRIQKILDMRHLLPSKFGARDVEKLNIILNKLLVKQTGGDGTEKADQTINVSGVVKGGANNVKAPAKPAAKPAAKPVEEVVEEATEPAASEEQLEEVVEEPKPATKPKPVVTQAAKPVVTKPATTKPTTAAVKKTTAPAAPVTPPANEENDPELQGILDQINNE